MKKHINTAEIMGELEGSVFFPSKPHTPIQQDQPPVKEEANSSTPVRDVPLAPPVLPVPAVPLERDVRPVPLKKRVMKQRHPFDIYHDQYDTLKQFAEDERRQG